MIRKKLGRTGLEVSIIGFGGLKLPSIDKEAAHKVLNRALDLGINYFDTARGYGDSEGKMGLAMRGRRREFISQRRVKL